MSNKPENPVAFPGKEHYNNSLPGASSLSGTFDNPGMTLRDYFAGLALPQCQAICGKQGIQGIAAMAYSFADEMLDERTK